MANEMDWIDSMSAERAAEDPEFAAANRRADLMLQLVPIRKGAGFTQEDMADRMGISRPQVAMMESRPHKVSLDRIAAYADALGGRLELVMPKVSRKGASRGRKKATIEQAA